MIDGTLVLQIRDVDRGGEFFAGVGIATSGYIPVFPCKNKPCLDAGLRESARFCGQWSIQVRMNPESKSPTLSIFLAVIQSP